MGFTYRTARAVMMVGSVSDPRGLTPQLIGPAHATISNVAGGGRKALCGAYVARDEQVAWPPEAEVVHLLCQTCSQLALL
jgi:hypothetical protein